MFKVGDIVIVNFPARPTDEDNLVGVYAPGQSYSGRVMTLPSLHSRPPWQRVAITDGHAYFNSWDCRPEWLEYEAAPW